jgi:hypothetical protein
MARGTRKIRAETYPYPSAEMRTTTTRARTGLPVTHVRRPKRRRLLTGYAHLVS